MVTRGNIEKNDRRTWGTPEVYTAHCSFSNNDNRQLCIKLTHDDSRLLDTIRACMVRK
jgi:hypothetical protein